MMLRLSLLLAACQLGAALQAQSPPPVPEALRGWEAWALREAPQAHSPPLYSDPTQRPSLWPATLQLQATPSGGTFSLSVEAFDPAWLPLPGGPEAWPQEVTLDGQPAPVLARESRPSLRLAPGKHTVAGSFPWKSMPERLPVPPEIGLLALTTDGKPVEAPDWEPDGTLWLKRTRAEAADRDLLTRQVYRVLEDGIPMLLHSEIELSVAGKSREESLGNLLPEGWLLSSLDAPIPCAVDEAGRLKAQVRAGKWTLKYTAFRTAPLAQFRYADGAQPQADSELIALRAAPQLRVIELRGISSIDVSQTTFPEAWRQLPIFLWDSKIPFQIEEKLRGMGHERPPGLKFQREFWLDEVGRSVTYRDRLTGSAQRTWRLDAAPGHALGAVKIGGVGQLITRNPLTQEPGVEVRTRDIQLEATGRAPFTGAVPATGWTSGAETLGGTLHLPPGWRLFALFGPEWTEGDWLTAWSLLDVFLLLVFSLSVYRLYGLGGGLVALLLLLLSWQEPGAPRWTWFALVAVLALVKVVPLGGRAAKILAAAQGLSLLALAAVALPFISQQVTGMLFPQVEKLRATPSLFSPVITKFVASSYSGEQSEATPSQERSQKAPLKSNLIYDQKAQIQTGPALPEWQWRTIYFGWNGPVSASQTIHPILLPSWVQRALVAVRLSLFAALCGILWKRRTPRESRPPSGPPPLPGALAAASAALLFALLSSPASAQSPADPLAQPSADPSPAAFPSPALLDQLRDLLLKPSDAFPRAAEIPWVKLTLADRQLTMEAVIHTATFAAVPLPGRLPAWSPAAVEIVGQPAPAVARRDGFLWIALPPGSHRVTVRGAVPSATEWQWTFELKPRLVEIAAPGWTVTGVNPSGVPEAQVFFARQQARSQTEAAYDRRDFNAVVAVDRHLELGLVWQVHTKITRLSAPGKALSLSLPLLPSERILTGGLTEANGRVDVRLGAAEASFTWESELPVQPAITLSAESTDRWIERWHLETSPLWNVALEGLSPIFAAQESDLIPTWHPWPGEKVSLAITRPEPLAGETTTVSRVTQALALSSQRRSTTLTLDVEASLGRDFPVALPGDADITSLTIGGQATPVRREDGRLIIPIRPGKQRIAAAWSQALPLATAATSGTVVLPVESANITTTMQLPDNRWILWTRGPLNGPAVRFWAVLLAAVLFAQILASIPLSPLTRRQWSLLIPGLTQIPLIGGGFLVLWLFWLAWRGQSGGRLTPGWFKLQQVTLAIGALLAAAVVVFMVHAGLLGRPTMFILGEGSWLNTLQWYQDRSPAALPATSVFSVSIWVYRGLMLAWCLWLAFTLLRLIRWAWTQFTASGLWR